MKSQSKLVAAISLSLLVACDPKVVEPPVDHPAPLVEKAEPNLIAAGGGTLARIYGDNFREGVQLFVGGVPATDVTWISSRAFTARIPAGTADTSVELRVVNPDNKAASLPNGIRYDITPTITDARMTMADPAEFFSAGEAVNADIRAALFVPTETGTAGVGQGQGVRAQVSIVSKGAASPTLASFTDWVDARYERDSSDPALNDWDVYKGVVTLPPTTGRTMLEYYAVVRFSVDAGATWIYADKDGIANGWSGAQLPQVRTGARRPEWCKANDIGVNSPLTVTYTVGQSPVTVRGQVHVSGVTNSSGRGAGVEMEIGYGSSSVDPSQWTWTAADYKGDLFGANDEFQAALPNPGVAGTYKWSFRASYAGGPYRYCDAGDNLEFSMSEANNLEVTGTTPTVVDWCKLGVSADPEPPPNEAYAASSTPYLVIQGLIYEQAVTDTAGPPSGLEAWVGYGPPDADVATSSWSWTVASFSADRGNNDEFSATLPNPGVLGQYKFAYRARVNGGGFAYCDADGLAIGGFTIEQAGHLAVVPRCSLGATTGSSSDGAGGFGFGATVTVDADLYHLAGVGVLGQVGAGPKDSDARSASQWTWVDSAVVGPNGTGGDTYRASFTPAITGARSVSARFSIDDGATWFYCDADGNADGYEVAQQGAFSTANNGAKPSTTVLDYCETLDPAGVAVGAKALGVIWEEGLTEVAGAPAGVVAELGVGPALEDPGMSPNWAFTAATFKAQVGNDDQFEAAVPSTPVGNGFAFRFQLNGGPWCYADLDGAGANVELNGFSVMTANVPPAANIGRVQ